MVRLQGDRFRYLINEARHQHRQGGAIKIIEAAEIAGFPQVHGELFQGFTNSSLLRGFVWAIQPAAGKADVP